MTLDFAPESYFQEARSWDMDRVALSGRSARIAWRVAGAGWICAVTSAIALVVLMPLKRVDPFVVRVDRSTGIVDVVPEYSGNASVEEAVTRYFLTHYVSVCERFNLSTAESDYEECGAFHGALRNQAWATLWATSNPASPLKLHRDGSTIRVQVEAVSFFKRASGVSDLAQVRYVRAERAGATANEAYSHWIATIQYVYVEPSRDARVRSWNPLGFKIVEFTAEPEVVAPQQLAAAPNSAEGVVP